MIRRMSLLRPIESRFFARRTRLKATKMANQCMGPWRRLGNTQWDMMPGSAVVPCRTCKALSLTHTTGNPRLTTLTFLYLSSLATVTFIFHGLLLVHGLTARTPGQNAHAAHVLSAPHTACSLQGLGGKNSVSQSSSLR